MQILFISTSRAFPILKTIPTLGLTFAEFKKAHNTLFQVISTLVSSDKYYLNGDLGAKANGSDVDATYFCETFSDVVSVKKRVAEK